MKKAKLYVFTNKTCPHCGSAKKFLDEFIKERNDFDLHLMPLETPIAQMKARELDVVSVPTFIIQGPAYKDNIGLRGVQTKETMNKYLDMSLGIIPEKKPTLREKLKKGIKIGKLRVKF